MFSLECFFADTGKEKTENMAFADKTVKISTSHRINLAAGYLWKALQSGRGPQLRKKNTEKVTVSEDA